MQLTTKTFRYMFNLCNIKYYFWLNNIDTSIVLFQEVHVFNNRIAFKCSPVSCIYLIISYYNINYRGLAKTH